MTEKEKNERRDITILNGILLTQAMLVEIFFKGSDDEDHKLAIEASEEWRKNANDYIKEAYK